MRKSRAGSGATKVSSNWKQHVADECWQQCVYCAIHESRYGGLDNFHVEHYRPKSLEQFAHLVNTITNLFLACAICNRFKGNDWPADPVADHSISAYPDPSASDYNSLFTWTSNFQLKGLYPSAKYILERLYLNRPQLMLERRTFAATSRLADFERFAAQATGQLEERGEDQAAIKLLGELMRALISLSQLFRQANSVRPYKLADVRRPRRARRRKATP
jgi:HNH endonuclease.